MEYYDVSDPFIDDDELLLQERTAASKDGFFVFSGPLVAEGEKVRIEKADGTQRRNGVKGPRGGKSTKAKTANINISSAKSTPKPKSAAEKTNSSIVSPPVGSTAQANNAKSTPKPKTVADKNGFLVTSPLIDTTGQPVTEKVVAAVPAKVFPPIPIAKQSQDSTSSAEDSSKPITTTANVPDLDRLAQKSIMKANSVETAQPLGTPAANRPPATASTLTGASSPRTEPPKQTKKRAAPTSTGSKKAVKVVEQTGPSSAVLTGPETIVTARAPDAAANGSPVPASDVLNKKPRKAARERTADEKAELARKAREARERRKVEKKAMEAADRAAVLARAIANPNIDTRGINLESLASLSSGSTSLDKFKESLASKKVTHDSQIASTEKRDQGEKSILVPQQAASDRESHSESPSAEKVARRDVFVPRLLSASDLDRNQSTAERSISIEAILD